jgi:hypothetical protein
MKASHRHVWAPVLGDWSPYITDNIRRSLESRKNYIYYSQACILSLSIHQSDSRHRRSVQFSPEQLVIILITMATEIHV